jgi:hypothetical protein
MLLLVPERAIGQILQQGEGFIGSPSFEIR